MKKLLLYAIFVVIGVTTSFAKPAEYKILYLIPFESDSYMTPYVRECEDMDKVRSYQLMGFWNGAQMALDEYGGKDVTINVVVRDISNDERKLRHVLEDEELCRSFFRQTLRHGG